RHPRSTLIPYTTLFRSRRQPLGAFELFNFSAKIDPVPAMLVQSHRGVIPDFYGLTTSFTRETLKPADVVLAEEPGAPWVKYIHGDRKSTRLNSSHDQIS